MPKDKGRKKAAKAGSNWKKLRKTIAPETASKRRRRSSTQGDESMSSALDKGKARSVAEEGDQSTASLPWFADDLSREDLELLRAGKDVEAKTRASAQSNGQPDAAHGGAEDALSRRRALLGGGADLAGEKREPGTYVAIDCEMVGVGIDGSESILARVSIVNWHGVLLYDSFVRPKEKVTDYRTWVSGVRPQDLHDAPSFDDVQKHVAALIRDRILVGHAIHNDLKALLLSHPRHLLRDTASYAGSRARAGTKYPSLRKLVALQLGIDIQQRGAPHSSVEDAQATMALYRSLHSEWQLSLQKTGQGRKSVVKSSGAAKAQIIGPGWKKNNNNNRESGKDDREVAATSKVPQTDRPKKRAAPDDPDWWTKV